MRRFALAAVVTAVAACSVLRGGPDLSGGGLELVYRIAPRPERAGQETALARAAAQTIAQRLKAVGCRGDAQAAGGHVRVRLPAKCGDLQRLKQLIGLGGRLEFREAAEEQETEALAAIAARTPPDTGVALDHETWSAPTGGMRRARTLKGAVAALEKLRAGLAPDAVPKDVEALIEPPSRADAPAVLRLVKREVALSGSALRKAEVVTDPYTKRPNVSITFTPAGADAFAALTKRLVGRKLAIVLDGRINSAPVVQSEIRGGKALITLSGKEPEALAAEARDLTIVLGSGALPEELELASEDVFPQPPAQELKLALEGPQLVVRLSSGGLWRMGSPPTPEELAPVITTARAASRRPRVELLVRGYYDVPEQTQRAVRKAIADAGFESVVCLKDNRNCR